MTTEPRRLRAIVVGATFGAVYAKALAARQSPVELVGLLSTGSTTSAALAERLGISLYTSIESLPLVDIAFVVVRSGVVGGDGVQIAEQLLSRGVHVLQEQPVHADEIVALLRIAAANAVLYGVNDFYSHVAPMRQFIAAAKNLHGIARISYIHARSSLHVVYPLFGILASIVRSLTPARIVLSERTDGPFVAGRVVLGDIPVDLLVQNELCASDPDNHARLLHAITVGCDAGELVLAHTHGSTRWHTRPHRSAGAAMDQPISEIVGIPFEPSADDVLNELWPDGIRAAAAEFAQAVRRGRTMVSQRTVRAIRLWSDFTSAMGPATLIEAQPPIRISAAELLAA